MQKESYGIWPNHGQITDLQGDPVPEVSFYTSGALPRAYFQKSGLFSLVLATGDSTSMDTLRQLDVACIGQHANYPDPIVWEMKQRYANFYFPQCAPNGATNVHAYARVIYPEMYPLIDMQIYSGKMGQKLAFVVNPGGDPKDIELQLTGQDQLDLDIYGNLKILLDGKWVVLPEALAYQVESNNDITPVNWTAEYQVNNGQATVRFNFDQFDHSKPLVFLIGPAAMGGTPNYSEEGICWSTYYGGDKEDYAKDAKSDLDGNYYVGGRSQSTFLSFPNIPGAVSLVNATSVATLTKFNAGNQLQWSNYFGGSVDVPANPGAEPRTFGEVVAVKEYPVRAIYLAGATQAPNLLIYQETGAFSDAGTNNTQDKGFIAKFDEFGFIQWSTYFGDHDVAIQGMDVAYEKIVISGHAVNNLPAPPVPHPTATVRPYGGGASDGFLAMFDANDQLIWCTYYGGSGEEDGVIVKANDAYIYLAGNTRSTNIPPVEPNGCYHQLYQGARDCFIAAFKANTGVLLWGTYLGGSLNETLGPKGLAASKDGDVFMTGITKGLPNLYPGPNWHDDTPAANGNTGFIARFKGDGTFAPLWISYLGGGQYHFPWCIAVDNYGTISVGGYSDDPDFEPVPRPGYYYQPNYLADGIDGFITQFDNDENRVWNTHFGGLTEGVFQGHIPENIMSLNDINGTLYATGYTEKHNVSVYSYFPLDNQESSAWFNDLFNGNGLSNLYSDGFITQFCNEMTIGIAPEPTRAEPGLQVLSGSSATFVLSGLLDGRHSMRVYDAQGRLVLARPINSMNGRTPPVQLGKPAAALYLIQVDEVQRAKYIPVQ